MNEHREQSNEKEKPVATLNSRCGAQMGSLRVAYPHRCQGKMIPAGWLEELVWKDITRFVMDPGDVLEQLQARMEEELATTPSNEERRQEIERVLGLKETERDRVLDAYRRSVIDIEELEEQITRSKAEAEPLHKELMELVGKEIETGLAVSGLATTEDLLRTLRDTIEGALDSDTRRAVVEGLVSGISVKTLGTGRSKQAAVTVSYRFAEPVYAVDNAAS